MAEPVRKKFVAAGFWKDIIILLGNVGFRIY
jgi:hypothetical protein